ncbi:MAG: hypothetical protein AAB462_01600 [Patescibacteria group bacterium]
MKNKLQIFATLVFVGYVAWWASFQTALAEQGLSVQRFSYIYGSMALLGAIVGLIASKKWGGYKTVIGKALLFFSLGLLAQEAGQLIYAYYIFVSHVDIPYPSWGDVAYFGSVLFYIAAAYFLTKVAGTRFSIKDIKYKAVAVVVPVVLLTASYSLLLRGYEYDFSQPLTVFLDFGYPIGQAIYVSIAITAYLLSRKLIGGVFKSGILFVILALLLQYVADSAFIYQSSRDSYISGGGVDLLYLVAYFAMATAMIKFLNIYKGLRAGNKPDIKKAPEDV